MSGFTAYQTRHNLGSYIIANSEPGQLRFLLAICWYRVTTTDNKTATEQTMPDFRFLHTADIHLDSPLRGLDREGEIPQRLRTATRDSFALLIGQAIELAVDFVIIAGDLYDGDWRDTRTGLFFAAQMGRLNEADIPVFIVRGNHDAESVLTQSLSYPDNVRFFSASAPESFILDSLGVALHGQSYPHREVHDNLALYYPEKHPSLCNIGVLHTGLGGMAGHGNYAPCTLDDMIAKGYDYWALGHVHQSQTLAEHPHIVFSGNTQGRHIRESGPKSAYLVTIRDNTVETCQPIYTDLVRWSELKVDIGDSGSLNQIYDRVRSAIDAEISRIADGRPLACRVRLTGKTDLHARLYHGQEDIHAEIQAVALGLGANKAWIERVILGTEPAEDAADRQSRLDAVGTILTMLADANDDAALNEDLRTKFMEFRGRLPGEISDVDADESGDPLLYAALSGDTASLIAQLSDALAGWLFLDVEM